MAAPAHTLIPPQKLAAHRKRHKLLFHLNRREILKTPNLPITMTLRNKIKTVYDQGQVGSCTVNSLLQAYNMLSYGSSFQPSRLYLYWHERLVEDANNAPITDTGADAVDGLTYLAHYGVCPEANWPYDPTQVNVAPPATCDALAKHHLIKGIGSLDVPTNDIDYASKLITNIKETIVNGYPIHIGVQVYQSFMSNDAANSGIISIPNPVNMEDPNDPRDPYLGGHEILITGYDDAKTLFQFVNSWGSGWGEQGFGYLPYNYVTNNTLTQEFRYFTSTTDMLRTMDTTPITTPSILPTHAIQQIEADISAIQSKCTDILKLCH